MQKIEVCCFLGVMMRLNSDIAHEVQCLEHCEFSTTIAVPALVIDLFIEYSEAAGCLLLK